VHKYVPGRGEYQLYSVSSYRTESLIVSHPVHNLFWYGLDNTSARFALALFRHYLSRCGIPRYQTSQIIRPLDKPLACHPATDQRTKTSFLPYSHRIRPTQGDAQCRKDRLLDARVELWVRKTRSSCHDFGKSLARSRISRRVRLERSIPGKSGSKPPSDRLVGYRWSILTSLSFSAIAHPRTRRLPTRHP
jgi:hypothetical protein